MSKIIKTRLYWHTSKESNLDILEELGEENDISHIDEGDFVYTGYEVFADVEIGNDGRVYATHFMDKKLEEKVEI